MRGPPASAIFRAMSDAPSRPAGDTCWAMTDGKAGMEVQCVGLAEALGYQPLVKRIQVTKPWRWLPPRLVPNPLGNIDCCTRECQDPDRRDLQDGELRLPQALWFSSDPARF